MSNDNPIHLFRALLRAAKRLPDELARTYIHAHIVQRFRDASCITPGRLKTARKDVSLLNRACEGEEKPLRRVLDHTYGRTGRRRREYVERLRALGETPLRAVMQSQAKNPPISNRPDLNTKNVRRPKIEENIWGRKPIKRTLSIEKKHETRLLKRLMPPLPEAHWCRLRDLSTGVLKEKPAKGMEKGRPDRFMRRMWGAIWNSSPLLRQEENGKWKVEWGGWRSPLSNGLMAKATKKDAELFESVQ